MRDCIDVMTSALYCVHQRCVQRLLLFFSSISSSFACSSGNVTWWFNGQCPPSSNTKPLLASVQWNNRKDHRETRKERTARQRWQRGKRDRRMCVWERHVLFEHPVVLWPGCRKVEAFPAHCTSEEITSVTLCHSHNYCTSSANKNTVHLYYCRFYWQTVNGSFDIDTNLNPGLFSYF